MQLEFQLSEEMDGKSDLRLDLKLGFRDARQRVARRGTLAAKVARLTEA